MSGTDETISGGMTPPAADIGQQGQFAPDVMEQITAAARAAAANVMSQSPSRSEVDHKITRIADNVSSLSDVVSDLRERLDVAMQSLALHRQNSNILDGQIMG